VTDKPPPKRVGGRPRARERGAVVSTWVAASSYDAMIRLARKHDVSISRVVQVRLRRALRAVECGDVTLPGDD